MLGFVKKENFDFLSQERSVIIVYQTFDHMMDNTAQATRPCVRKYNEHSIKS
jgi:shikimate kinase